MHVHHTNAYYASINDYIMVCGHATALPVCQTRQYADFESTAHRYFRIEAGRMRERERERERWRVQNVSCPLPGGVCLWYVLVLMWSIRHDTFPNATLRWHPPDTTKATRHRRWVEGAPLSVESRYSVREKLNGQIFASIISSHLVKTCRGRF